MFNLNGITKKELAREKTLEGFEVLKLNYKINTILIKCAQAHSHEYDYKLIKCLSADDKPLKCKTCNQNIKTLTNLRTALETLFNKPFKCTDERKINEDICLFNTDLKIVVSFFKHTNVAGRNFPEYSIKTQPEKKVIFIKICAKTRHVTEDSHFYKLKYLRDTYITDNSIFAAGLKEFNHLIGRNIRKPFNSPPVPLIEDVSTWGKFVKDPIFDEYFYFNNKTTSI